MHSSLDKRIQKVAKTVGTGVSPENVFITFAINEEGNVFILLIHNTALKGIAPPSIHDTDITDEAFIRLSAIEQRVSVDTIYTALSNSDNFVLED